MDDLDLSYILDPANWPEPVKTFTEILQSGISHKGSLAMLAEREQLAIRSRTTSPE